MTRCTSGKVVHRNQKLAEIAARGHHMSLNRDGKLAQTLFMYPCHRCKGWHLTRLAEWQGRPHRVAAVAAPERLQRWAMPERFADLP